MEVPKLGRSELIPQSFLEHQARLRNDLDATLTKRSPGPVDPALAVNLIPSETFSPTYDDTGHPFNNDDANSFTNATRYGGGSEVALTSFPEKMNAPAHPLEGGVLGKGCFNSQTAALEAAPREPLILGEPATQVLTRILNKMAAESVCLSGRVTLPTNPILRKAAVSDSMADILRMVEDDCIDDEYELLTKAMNALDLECFNRIAQKIIGRLRATVAAAGLMPAA